MTQTYSKPPRVHMPMAWGDEASLACPARAGLSSPSLVALAALTLLSVALTTPAIAAPPADKPGTSQAAKPAAKTPAKPAATTSPSGKKGPSGKNGTAADDDAASPMTAEPLQVDVAPDLGGADVTAELALPERLAGDEFYKLDPEFQAFQRLATPDNAPGGKPSKRLMAAFEPLVADLRELARADDPDTAQAANFRLGVINDALANAIDPAADDETATPLARGYAKAARTAFAPTPDLARRQSRPTYWSASAYERLSFFQSDVYPRTANPYYTAQTDPNAPDKINALAPLLRRAEWMLAWEQLGAIPQDQKKTAAFHSAACAVYTAWYQRARAVGHCMKALSLQPSYGPAARNLVRLGFTFYDLPVIAYGLEVLADSKVPPHELAAARGALLALIGQPEKARDELQNALREHPDSYEALYVLTLLPTTPENERLAGCHELARKLGETGLRIHFSPIQVEEILALSSAFNEHIKSRTRAP